MDIFKEVRERADILQVCDVLGIKLNRNHKCICPFSNHKEKTASFSVSPSKNIFCCFGCGEKGNSITLVQKLLNISPLEAAKYINDMLHLGIDVDKHSSYFEINTYKQKQQSNELFKKWEYETIQLMCDYYQYLREWVAIRNPKCERYIKAIKEINYIEYLIDEVFINGDVEDKLYFKRNEVKLINKIKEDLKLKTKE